MGLCHLNMSCPAGDCDFAPQYAPAYGTDFKVSGLCHDGAVGMDSPVYIIQASHSACLFIRHRVYLDVSPKFNPALDNSPCSHDHGCNTAFHVNGTTPIHPVSFNSAFKRVPGPAFAGLYHIGVSCQEQGAAVAGSLVTGIEDGPVMHGAPFIIAGVTLVFLKQAGICFPEPDVKSQFFQVPGNKLLDLFFRGIFLIVRKPWINTRYPY